MRHEIIQKDGQIYAVGTFTDDHGAEVYFEHPVESDGTADQSVSDMIVRYRIVNAALPGE